MKEFESWYVVEADAAGRIITTPILEAIHRNTVMFRGGKASGFAPLALMPTIEAARRTALDFKHEAKNLDELSGAQSVVVVGGVRSFKERALSAEERLKLAEARIAELDRIIQGMSADKDALMSDEADEDGCFPGREEEAG